MALFVWNIQKRQPIETKSRLVVIRDLGEGKSEEWLLNGCGVPFCSDVNVWTRWWWWLHIIVNVLKATELCPQMVKTVTFMLGIFYHNLKKNTIVIISFILMLFYSVWSLKLVTIWRLNLLSYVLFR